MEAEFLEDDQLNESSNIGHKHRMAILVCLFAFYFYSNDLRFIPGQNIHIQWTMMHASIDLAGCLAFAALLFWMMTKNKLKEAVLLSAFFFLTGTLVLLLHRQSSITRMISLFCQSGAYSMFCLLGPRFTTLWLPFKQRMLYFAVFGLALYLGDLLQSSIVIYGFNGDFCCSDQYYFVKLIIGLMFCLVFVLFWSEPTFLANSLSSRPFDKLSLAFRFILGNGKFLRITLSHTLLFPMSYDQDNFITGSVQSLACILISIAIFYFFTRDLKNHMKLSFSLLILVWGGVLLIKVSLKYFNAFSLRVVQIGFNSVTYFFDSSGYILSQEYCFDLLFPFNPVYVDLFQIVFTKIIAILYSLLLYFIESSLWLYICKVVIIAFAIGLSLSLKTDYRPLF